MVTAKNCSEPSQQKYSSLLEGTINDAAITFYSIDTFSNFIAATENQNKVRLGTMYSLWERLHIKIF